VDVSSAAGPAEGRSCGGGGTGADEKASSLFLLKLGRARKVGLPEAMVREEDVKRVIKEERKIHTSPG